jgi:hypothetical protein
MTEGNRQLPDENLTAEEILKRLAAETQPADLQMLEQESAALLAQSEKNLANLHAINGPRVRWSYLSENLNRVMYIYLSKLNPGQMAEYQTAEEIMTRLAHSIEEEERRVVRKGREE